MYPIWMDKGENMFRKFESVCLCAYPQERRREFEANLEKAGLELETEDKSVRNSTTELQHHLVDSFLRHTIF